MKRAFTWMRFPKYTWHLMSAVFILCYVTPRATSPCVSPYCLTDFMFKGLTCDSCKTFQTWSNNANHYTTKHYSPQKTKGSYCRGWSFQNSPAGSWKSYTWEASLSMWTLTLLTTNTGTLALLYLHFDLLKYTSLSQLISVLMWKGVM